MQGPIIFELYSLYRNKGRSKQSKDSAGSPRWSKRLRRDFYQRKHKTLFTADLVFCFRGEWRG